MKILILKGLPASGKSTWSKEYVKENKNWVRVNRDDLRNMRGEYWIPKQEDMITKWEDACIRIALEAGNNVILDATNLNQDRNRERVKQLKQIFPNLIAEYKTFDTPLEECIKRDLKRQASVGESVIRGMYDKYLAPPKVVYKEDTSLPKCILVDVDNTIAKMVNRTPFEWSKVKQDEVKENIVNVVKMFHKNGKKIFIFTGRDGCCLEDTRQWLLEKGVPFDNIFIRPAGNNEKDSIIKKRLFEENIRGKYFCELVLDDRDQVVKMWREDLGLTCLQVDYGNF